MENKINTAVILAAGLGSRLGQKTKSMPKGFLKVGSDSLIERSFRLLKENGISNIIIGCGHENIHFQKVKEKYDLDIYYNHEYDSTGSLYTLILANEKTTSDFLLLESDLLYESRALDILIKAPEANVILLSGTTHSGDEVYAECDQDGVLTQLSKDRNEVRYIKGELVGISRLSKSTLSKLNEYVSDDPFKKQLDYEKGLVHVAREQNIQVKLVDDLIWCEVDNQEHLTRAETKIFPLLEKSKS